HRRARVGRAEPLQGEAPDADPPEPCGERAPTEATDASHRPKGYGAGTMRRVPDPEPLWQRRFRAPIVGFPHWSRRAPDHLIYASSESGIYQLHAWNRATGEKRQVTSEPVGLISGEMAPDGEWVVWHRDVTGD